MSAMFPVRFGLLNCHGDCNLLYSAVRCWLKSSLHIIYSDLCAEAGTSVNGGQTVINPWVIIGGVASAVCNKSEFIMWAHSVKNSGHFEVA